MKPSVNQLLPAANSSIILVSRIVMALNRGVVRIAHLGNRPSRVERSCLAILDAPAARLRWYAQAPALLRCRGLLARARVMGFYIALGAHR